MSTETNLTFGELTADNLFHGLIESMSKLLTEYRWHSKHDAGECWFEPHVGAFLLDDGGRLECFEEGLNYRMPCKPDEDLCIDDWFPILESIVKDVKELKGEYSSAKYACIEVVLVHESDDFDCESDTIDYACVDVCFKS